MIHKAIVVGGSWRTGFVVMAAVDFLSVFVPALFLIRGLKRDTPVAGPQIVIEEKSWTRGEALRSLRFYKMVAVFGLGYVPLGTMLVQQVPFLTDMGIPAAKAAWILSFTSLMGMAGKLFWGWLFDKVEGRWTLVASFSMQAFAIFLLMHATTMSDALVFAFFFGFGMGGTVPMHTAMRARQFGAANLGAIMGISSPIIMLAQAGGQPFAGYIFDTTGSYRIAFNIFICLYLVGILVVLTLRDPDRLEENKTD